MNLKTKPHHYLLAAFALLLAPLAPANSWAEIRSYTVGIGVHCEPGLPE